MAAGQIGYLSTMTEASVAQVRPDDDAAVAREYYRQVLLANVGEARVTALDEAPQLSKRLGNRILLKREDQQPVFSFKLRGAFNTIEKRMGRREVLGVIAASAGNHAQGVALAAKQLSLPAVIVMPRTTPEIKVDAVRALGAEVVLHGDNFDEALAVSLAIGRERGFDYVHPFDDADTIAGQGTVAREIDRQYERPIDVVFVCLGGGGLAAGMAAYLKHVRPTTKVVGVEPDDAACMRAAFAAGEVVTLPSVGIFADGAAVKRAGELTYALCRRFLDEIITVSVDEISNAIKDVFTDTRTLIEPAGALAIAGLKRYVLERDARGQTLVATVSGANVSFDRLRHIVERVEVGEERECLLAVRIPERPRSFLTFCRAIGHRSITEFNYRYAGPAHADVFLGVQLSDGNPECARIVDELRQNRYDVLDVTQDESAKLHTRYLVGGRTAHPAGVVERLFRCRFPERPGALAEFLEALPIKYSISLFHYRNHGAAFGRVLLGLHVPVAEARNEIGPVFPFEVEEESGNDALSRFLGSSK